MGINQYEEQLKGVYAKHYCSGECVNYPQCKKGLVDDGLLFNCAKLGKHYGDGTYRKVLVVGKEPVTENRAITPTEPLEKADNQHYRRTLYTLASILDKAPKSDALSDLKNYEELLDYFCLTNYFKCSFTETAKENDEKKAKKRSGVEVSKAMKRECWNILMDEIDELKPEIIIIQGTSYSNAFWRKIEERYGKNTLRKLEYKKGYEQLTKHNNGPDGSPLYVVWAYHPTARAPYTWNQRIKNLQYVLGKLKELLVEKKVKIKL